jgi:hypothetical protein
VQGAVIQKLAVDQRHTHRVDGKSGIVEVDTPALPETDIDQLTTLNKTLNRLNEKLDDDEERAEDEEDAFDAAYDDAIEVETVEDGDGSLPEFSGQQDQARGSPDLEEERSLQEDGVEVEALHVDDSSF